MRALLLVLLVGAPFVAAEAGEAREVAANHVLDTRCPSYTGPATVACFAAPPGATGVAVAARPFVGDAQPRMLVQLQNGTALWRVEWLCEDRAVGFGSWNVTQVVVTLHADRLGCAPDHRAPLFTGRLTVAWT